MSKGIFYDGVAYKFEDERFDSLAAVAASGSYNDLEDKPVLDGTVTASGANAVTGAAVASYVDSVLGGVANGSY